MKCRSGLATIVIAVALCAVPGAQARSLKQRFFVTPTRNISCELDVTRDYRGLPTSAYCETFNPKQSVTMSATGRLRFCHGDRCLSNPPVGVSVLRYGRQVRLGPFTCRSRRFSGVRCTVPSGHGFVISRAGMSRI